MSSVTKHIVVRLDMTVPEARELLGALRDFPSDHPTDEIFHQLNQALDGLDEEDPS